MKYYRIDDILGVCGTEVGQTDGEYTFLPKHYPGYEWIYTKDLYNTPEEAQKAKQARFLTPHLRRVK
jgi:hypothetical protein